MKRFVVITLVTFGCVAFASGQTSTARRVIDANTRAFVEAFNKGDIAAVANMYAVDGKVLPPNDKIVEGRANIQTFWTGASGAGMKIVSLTATDVIPSGNLIVETGKYVITVPGSSGGTARDEGKYVVVWRREGRNWKLIRDIFNSDKPAQ